MSNSELPRSVDPYRLTGTGAELEGVIPLAKLSRFRDSVLAIPEGGQCRVRLAFTFDGERRRIVSGQLEAEVQLECQRCLTGMNVTLSSQFDLGLVSGEEQARQLPSELEPFVINDGVADLWTMAEDELLLALPAYPLHDRRDCPATAELEALEPKPDQQDEAAADGEKRDNPFKVLEGLKKTRH